MMGCVLAVLKLPVLQPQSDFFRLFYIFTYSYSIMCKKLF